MTEVVIDGTVLRDDTLARAVDRAIEEQGFEPVEAERNAKLRRGPRRAAAGPFPPWEVLLWVPDDLADGAALYEPDGSELAPLTCGVSRWLTATPACTCSARTDSS